MSVPAKKKTRMTKKRKLELAAKVKEQRKEPFRAPKYPGKRTRKTSHVNLDPEGLRVCGYCNEGINPFKKLGTVWCSHSCRTMAYFARKAQEAAGDAQ